jgi:predicted Zn-dependent protease
MRRLLYVLFSSLALLAGCATDQTTQNSAVGVERKQRFLVSEQDVDQASAQAYQQVLAEAQKQNALDKDAATLQRVKGIVGRLVPATGALRADAPKWPWEAHVLSSKEVNAWCMAGGKIAVYTGLIEQLKPSDDELAAVIGHEMGHALREHVREQASRQMGEQLALGVVGAVLNVPDIVQQLAPTVLDVTFNLPHSRAQESEADRVGVELAARAGYDPRAAISLWQKMAKLGGAKPPQILSTHPSDEARLKDLASITDKVMPLYQAAKSSGSASAGK